MSYENVKKVYLSQAPASALDYLVPVTAAGVLLTLLPDAKEKMWVFGWGGRVTTAITANGFNTIAPVFSMSFDPVNVGSPVEKSTLPLVINSAYAIGKEIYGTDFTPFIVDGALGDSLEFNVKTAGTGATTTGCLIPFIIVGYEHSLDGVA